MAKTRIQITVIVVLNCLLFEVGLIANAIGAVIPDGIRDLRLSYTTAALLPFTYFISYLFISVPAGILSERTSAKHVVLGSVVLVFAGTFAFALFPYYWVILASLFMIGCGLAATQVPLFPLMRTACGGEHLAFFTTLTSLMYGTGSIVSPYLYSQLVQRLQSSDGEDTPIRVLSQLVANSYPWVSMYWVFSAVLLATIVALSLVRLPPLELSEEERAAALPVYLALFRGKTTLFYAFGVFAYVACEQGTANWLSQFLKTYHGFEPQTQGAGILSWYWTLLTAGCMGGMVLLKLIDSRRVLAGSSLLAAGAFTGAVFGGKTVAVVCFPVVGLFISVLWPIIVALALNSIERHHGAVMGILMSSTIGGAFGPFAVGRLADTFGLRAGMTCLYLAFLFMTYLGLWARPLVGNATVFVKKEREDLYASSALSRSDQG